MAQRPLPKELQTEKTKSLNKDLKKIAEELIADKFDIKEEVVEKKRSTRPFDTMDTFERDVWGNIFNTEDLDNFRRRQQGYFNEIKVSIQPWSGHRVAQLMVEKPTLDSIIDCFKRFDRERIVKEEIVADIEFIRELHRRDRNFAIDFMPSHAREVEGAKHDIGKIFGVSIVIARNFRGAMLVGRL